MSHELLSDQTQWFPMPAALVVSQEPGGRANVMGIGYVGFTCWRPPILYLGMNTARHSGDVIRRTREFVVALPDPAQVHQVDFCGFVSGADCDKFAAAGFSQRAAAVVAVPLIDDCPVNLECQLRQVVPLGSHDLFLAEVVRTHVSAEYSDGRRPLTPLILISRRYVAASEDVGPFGVSNGCPPSETNPRSVHPCAN